MLSPQVSVIIVNYNGKELLKKCLESLFKVQYDNFEVIVVDNNSKDESIEFVTKNYPSVIMIKLDVNKGFAEPNNLGTKVAKGEYFLFLNNDTIVTPNFISEMIKIIKKDKKIGICQSLLLKPDRSIDSSGDFIDELGVVYNSKTKTNQIRKISSARGASMLIQSSIFEKLGGFDEKFFVSFEDVDISWRTWILGYHIVLVPTSIVYHLGGTTIKKMKSEIAFHGFKNQLSMKLTNFELKFAIKNTILFFIIYGFREFRIWLDYKFKGSTLLTSTNYEEKIADKPSIFVIIKSLLWICTNFRYILKKHHKINSQRILSTVVLQDMKIIHNEVQ